MPSDRSTDTTRAAPQPRLGPCLRAVRRRRDLTLQDVSDRTGVAVSTLSKVENDQMSLTYDKLLQICGGLGISINELLSPDDSKSVARTRRSITEPSNTLRQTTENYDYRYLSSDLIGKRMVPVLATLRARSLEDFGPLFRHAGEEFVYVLAGAIEVHTEHYAPRRLGTGDSCYIDSTMGHAYVAVSEEEARILCVCSAPEPDLNQMIDKVRAALDAEG